jgi:hypothetical protein
MVNGTRTHFDREQLRLKGDVAQLGALARSSLARATPALIRGDVDLAADVVAMDSRVTVSTG